MGTVTTVIVGIFGGGAFFAFLQFLINRNDGQKEKRDEILAEVKSTRKDVAEFKEEAEERFCAIDRKIDDTKAIQARARILRFNDEVQNGQLFSHNSWAQTHRDITDYKAHCSQYKDFPNSEADAAISNLAKVQAELLARERSGEKVFL